MKRWFVCYTIVVSLFAATFTAWASPILAGSGSVEKSVTINGAIRPKGIW